MFLRLNIENLIENTRIALTAEKNTRKKIKRDESEK